MNKLKFGKYLLFLSTLILVGYFSPTSSGSTQQVELGCGFDAPCDLRKAQLTADSLELWAELAEATFADEGAHFASTSATTAQQVQPTHCDPLSPTFCDFRRFPSNVVPYYISYSHYPENGGEEKLGSTGVLGQRERDGIQEALKMWSDASGLEFVEHTEPLPPNTGISFGWTYLPEFILGRVFAQWPGDGNTNGSRVVFNRNLDWTNFHTDNFNAQVDFVSVAAHEIGHALGMTHTGNVAAMMYRAGYESKRSLHEEDIARVQILYPRGGGGNMPASTGGDCVIPTSGPWPACASNGGGTTAPAPTGGDCVIPASGPWPPCASNGGGTTAPPAPTGGNCVIPASGPWPPCATNGGGGTIAPPPSNNGGCVIPASGPWPPCAK